MVVTHVLLCQDPQQIQQLVKRIPVQLMVAGVPLLTGMLALCLVELGSIAEQGFVTAQHQLMVVMTALRMVQATLKQRTATQIHVQLTECMESGLNGQIAPPAVEADTKHGQEYATALLQLMVETIVRVPRLIANYVAWRCALMNVQQCKVYLKLEDNSNAKQFAASIICIYISL